jgi:hypothetical protein
MTTANREIVEKEEPVIKETQAPVVERSTTRQSLLGEAAGFLTTLAVRAAQNYAAYCLEDWIAPRRALAATKTSLVPATDDSSMPCGRRSPPERVNGSDGRLESVLLVGGSKVD